MNRIDIDDDEITELKSGGPDYRNGSRLSRTDHANAQLEDMFLVDTDESYTQLMREFLDLRTLDKRIGKEKESIACQYLSKKHG